jgi:hypothetical protein
LFGFGREQLGRLEAAECGYPFNNSRFDPADTGQLEVGFGNRAGRLKGEVALAGDFAGTLL